MVSAVQGVLITCDDPLKEYIKSLNEALPTAEKFIIADVRQGGLLVKPSSVGFVTAKIKGQRDSFQYEKEVAA